MAEPQVSTKSSDAIDPLIGRVINDRFEVLSLIARGGMGRVYRAKQQPLGRLVAIKILDPRQANSPEDQDFQTRFFLEASTSAKLSHPNTVTVFDYGKTEDGIFYIVMELVEGRTLAQILTAQAPIEPARAVHMAVQIARSLREAHGQGIVHRDLKPANVIITKHGDEDDFAKVLDFGLVKNVEDDVEMTQAGVFMGSPKYMAPEQIQGGDVDGRTDVYALGCILYYMLVGRVPFERENQVQILMAHCREAPPPMIRDDGVTVPQGLVQVVLRCLAKEKDQRFSGMNDLIAALKHASSNAGMSVMSSGSTTISDLDLSGMRSIGGTPSGGIQIRVTPSGGMPIDDEQSPLAAELARAAENQEPEGSRTPIIAAVLLLAVVIGGGGAWWSLKNKQEAARLATEREEARQAAIVAATPVPAAVQAPAAPQAQPNQARIQILLTSTPGGAEVFVDEHSIGQTPLDIEWVGDQATPGRAVSFRFVKTGFRPSTVERVIGGERIEVDARLEMLARPTTSSMSSAMSEGVTVTRPGYAPSPY